MPTEITPELIAEAANEAAIVKVDGTTVESHPLPAMIAVDLHNRRVAVGMDPKRTILFRKIVPPGPG